MSWRSWAAALMLWTSALIAAHLVEDEPGFWQQLWYTIPGLALAMIGVGMIIAEARRRK